MDNEVKEVKTEARPESRSDSRDYRDNRDSRDGQRPFRPRRKKKVCAFCAEKIEHIDYKDIPRLRKNLTERSKILPRRVTGNCALHQRQLTEAVKRARHIALIPYISD